MWRIGIKTGSGNSCLFLPSNESSDFWPQLESYADKMREIVTMFGWLTPLYWVVFYVSLLNEIKPRKIYIGSMTSQSFY